MASYAARHADRAVALVQGLAVFVFGYFTATSVGDANGDLTFAWLWVVMLFAAGIGAVVLVARHSKALWIATGAAMSTAMLGRGLDIVWNIDEFVGRPALAAALWLGMGSATLTTWAAVGAMAGALDDEQ